MLTDDDVRDLLHRAGATVDVDPAPAVVDVPARSRRLPVLAAAAAAVIVALVTVLATWPQGQDTEPAPPATDPVRVPSVLGYDFDTALAALRAAGFSLTTESFYVCNVSYVAGTEPAAGTPVAPGAEVVVRRAAADPGAFCISDMPLALGLLAFADRRGPVPRLAQLVTLYDGSGNQVVLTADQAADPERWSVCTPGSGCTDILDELSDAAHRPYPIDAHGRTRYQSPVLTTEPDPACAFEPGARGFGVPASRIGVMFRVDGTFCTQEFVIDVHRNADGLIEAVGLLERVEDPGSG